MTYDNLSNEEISTLEAYDEIAAKRGNLLDPDFWKKEFEKFRNFLGGGMILDIACGNGRDAKLFIGAGYGYVGIDLSGKTIEAANKNVPGAEFIRMDFYHMPFSAGVFDGFWAAAALIHVPKGKVSLVLNQIRKVVRIGGFGTFIMKEGEGEKMVTGSMGEKRFFSFYSLSEFRRILEANGFEIEECYPEKRSRGKLGGADETYLIYHVRVKK